MKSQISTGNGRNQSFPYRYYFCLMMERSETGSGSVLMLNGSAYCFPKSIIHQYIRRNTSIQRIRYFCTLKPASMALYLPLLPTTLLPDDLWLQFWHPRWKLRHSSSGRSCPHVPCSRERSTASGTYKNIKNSSLLNNYLMLSRNSKKLERPYKELK